MEWRRLAKILGLLTLFVGAIMVGVTCYAAIEAFQRHPSPENESAFRALSYSSGITLVFGGGLFALGYRSKNEFLRREAFITVGVSWFLCAFFGALPYLFCHPGLGVVESFFESMSGFTTTGATVMTDIESFPNAILLWRAVTQYLGGIGILVLFVSVLSFLGVGGRSMMAQESSLNISESRATKIGETALGLIKVYLALSLVCFIGLLALGMPLFDSVCHTFTAISTAGFSPKNDSIGHYQNLGIEIWIGIFMLLGSIGFMFYLLIVKKDKDDRDRRRIRTEEEAKFFLVLIAVSILAVAGDLTYATDRTFLESLRECFFLVIAIGSTTGFVTGDYNHWPVFSKILLMTLLVIGGCAGSTAGGLKMNRVILFKRLTFQALVQSFRPNQVFTIRINGVAPDQKVLLQGTMYFALAWVVFGLSLVIVALLQTGMDLESVIGAVLGCLFNTGPGFGLVGPHHTYAHLNDSTMVFLSLLMAMGRLEFFAVLVLFVPALWKRY